VLGVCQILGKYWEMIPVAISRVLLNKVINDLAYDASYVFFFFFDFFNFLICLPLV
jgi:hypothetical protein